MVQVKASPTSTQAKAKPNASSSNGCSSPLSTRLERERLSIGMFPNFGNANALGAVVALDKRLGVL